MKKLFVLAIALMVISAPAFANLVVNGDFSTGDETGWTQWNSTWGGSFAWDATSGAGVLQTSGGSFGWYQAITVTPGKDYMVDTLWTGNGSNNWVEVLFFNDDGRTMLEQMDAPLDSSVIAKVDGWGMNGGNPINGGELISAMNGDYWFPSGLQTNVVTATGTTMYVGLKTGASGGSSIAMFDDVTVTEVVPEPASMLALFAGLGGLIIRRKR